MLGVEVFRDKQGLGQKKEEEGAPGGREGVEVEEKDKEEGEAAEAEPGDGSEQGSSGAEDGSSSRRNDS